MQGVINKLNLHNPLLRGNPIEGFRLKDHSGEWLVTDRGYDWVRNYLLGRLKEHPFLYLDRLHNGDYYKIFKTNENTILNYAKKYAKMSGDKNITSREYHFNKAYNRLKEDPIGFLHQEYNNVQVVFTHRYISEENAFDIWSDKIVNLDETFKNIDPYIKDPWEALNKIGCVTERVNDYTAIKLDFF